MKRKGILLAAGSGTRMGELTAKQSKQLLPVGGVPMVLYPLRTLRCAGIEEVLVICRAEEKEEFGRICQTDCAVQSTPAGIAEGLLIAEEWLDGAPSVLGLGDNLLHGPRLTEQLTAASRDLDGATVFAYPVENPGEYGVVELGQDGHPISLAEKPASPRSKLAVPGIYFYDQSAPQLCAHLKPSGRGELEITDLNRLYLEQGKLKVVMLDRGTTWIDIGTPEALARANSFVRESGCAPAAIDC